MTRSRRMGETVVMSLGAARRVGSGGATSFAAAYRPSPAAPHADVRRAQSAAIMFAPPGQDVTAKSSMFQPDTLGSTTFTFPKPNRMRIVCPA